MLQFIVILAIVGGGLWYLGVWPFDVSYSFLPKYAEWKNKKTDTLTPPEK